MWDEANAAAVESAKAGAEAAKGAAEATENDVDMDSHGRRRQSPTRSPGPYLKPDNHEKMNGASQPRGLASHNAPLTLLRHKGGWGIPLDVGLSLSPPSWSL